MRHLAWLALMVLAGLVLFAGSASVAGSANASGGGQWWMLGGGSAGCVGPGGPYTATIEVGWYAHGTYPTDVFSKDDPAPPNPPWWAWPDIQRYGDRLDIASGCSEPVALTFLLKSGTEVRGEIMPGVHRTLDARELASLGIRFKLSELAGYVGLGVPVGPPPYDFVIGSG